MYIAQTSSLDYSTLLLGIGFS